MAHTHRVDDPNRITALDRALMLYRRGRADVEEAAQLAGLEEWAFLEEAKAVPPTIQELDDHGLQPFIRPRD
ncbi:MAG: UPF0175 family protein [Euryarchaeota archaeon]|nr:UPF0175 family protein [Euryarchaeota archaeon]